MKNPLASMSRWRLHALLCCAGGALLAGCGAGSEGGLTQGPRMAPLSFASAGPAVQPAEPALAANDLSAEATTPAAAAIPAAPDPVAPDAAAVAAAPPAGADAPAPAAKTDAFAVAGYGAGQSSAGTAAAGDSAAAVPST